MTDLFDSLPPDPKPRRGSHPARTRPLADRLRPDRLEAVIGQDHLLAPDAPIGRMRVAGRLGSLILWGPPGVGKTTLARLLAAASGLAFEQISAIFTSVADLRRLFDAARLRAERGGGTVLFVDEIHRFNKAQQDAFLPHMEDGTIVLIGATTENPSFALNAALVSRAQVAILRRLDLGALAVLLERAETALGAPLPLTPEARAALLAMADGDGRALLNLVEALAGLPPDRPLDPAGLAARLSRRVPRHDRAGDQHYALISALHKSVRSSDPDAALYWLARILEGGDDPRYVARRLVRMAAEDIGLADPAALGLALAGWQAYERLGSPEGDLALAEVAVHLAMAPKSNAVYTAWQAATAAVRRSGSLPPPAHSVNAPTALMKQQGFGAGYVYDHDAPDGIAGQRHLPDALGSARFYAPTDRGFEAELSKRLAKIRRFRETGAMPDAEA